MGESDKFKRLGVFATAEQLDAIKWAYRTPCMVIGGRVPTSPWELIDKYAVENGLPETETQYGLDFSTGEFLGFVEGGESKAQFFTKKQWDARK